MRAFVFVSLSLIAYTDQIPLRVLSPSVRLLLHGRVRERERVWLGCARH